MGFFMDKTTGFIGRERCRFENRPAILYGGRSIVCAPKHSVFQSDNLFQLSNSIGAKHIHFSSSIQLGQNEPVDLVAGPLLGFRNLGLDQRLSGPPLLCLQSLGEGKYKAD